MQIRFRRTLTLLLAATSVVACKSAIKEDPLLRLSAAEALAEGKRLVAEEKYSRARDYLQHAFEVEPNSAGGREALLMVADTLALQGGKQRMIEAEAKYRDFLTRFPTSEKAGYVQYQIGNALVAQLGKPDRDQTPTVEAIEAFEELIRLYPTSPHVDEAEGRIRDLRGRLAAHEFEIGYFYLRYGLPGAAISRFEGILEQYPDDPETPKVLFHLGRAFHSARRIEQARTAFDRLRDEFPESKWTSDIPRLPPPAPAPEATATNPELEPEASSRAPEPEASS